MSAYNYYGTITLPDGRRVTGRVDGYVEYDTDAWITTDLFLEWEDGGELDADELNQPIGDSYLHEWVEERLLLLPPELPDDEP